MYCILIIKKTKKKKKKKFGSPSDLYYCCLLTHRIKRIWTVCGGKAILEDVVFFFDLAPSHLFEDAPQSHFRCRDP